MSLILYCNIVVALFDNTGYSKETVTTDIYVEGEVIEHIEDGYIIDFSKDIKRFPVVDSGNNFKRVKVEKDKCRL